MSESPHVTQHVSEDDLALFALAMMSPEEAALTAAHLKYCDLCRNEVARLQGDLVGYAMTAEMHEPPAAARERLMRSVAKERKFVPQPQPAAEPVLPARNQDLFETRPRFEPEPVRSGMGAFGWFGWAVAAALAGLLGWQFFQGEDMRKQIAIQSAAMETVQRQPSSEVARAQEILRTLTDPEAMQVSLQIPHTGVTPRPEGHAVYDARRGDLIFTAFHLHPLREDKTYELWLLPANGDRPLPAGLFRPDPRGNAAVVLPPLPKHIAAKGFGVTEEDGGGSATPTAPILLAGS